MTTRENTDKMLRVDKKRMANLYRKYKFQSFFKRKYYDDYSENLDFLKKCYENEADIYYKYLDHLMSIYNYQSNNLVMNMIHHLEQSYEDTCYYYKQKGELDCFNNPDVLSIIHKDITRNKELHDEVYGLGLTKYDVFRFHGGSEAMLYLREHTRYFNGGDDLSYYGIYPMIEKGILRRINIVVPPVKDLKSALINVHEYKQGIDLYDLIGEKYPDTEEFVQKEHELGIKAEEEFVKQYIRNK